MTLNLFELVMGVYFDLEIRIRFLLVTLSFFKELPNFRYLKTIVGHRRQGQRRRIESFGPVLGE
jgi:hypothetical protein